MSKALFKFITHCSYIYLCICCKVCTQIILSAQLLDDHGNLFDMRLCSDKTLYLSKLDTQTSQFYLIVKSAKYHHITVFIQLSVVAGTVHSLSAELNKSLGCLFGKILIALCHADSAHIKLTYYAVGSYVAEFVNNIFRIVQQRSSHSNILCIRQLCRIAGNSYLCRTVGIEYSYIRRALLYLVTQGHRISFAAGHYHFTLCYALPERLILHILLES